MLLGVLLEAVRRSTEVCIALGTGAECMVVLGFSGMDATAEGWETWRDWRRAEVPP